jgi:hypothetical protein
MPHDDMEDLLRWIEGLPHRDNEEDLLRYFAATLAKMNDKELAAYHGVCVARYTGSAGETLILEVVEGQMALRKIAAL